MTEPAEQIMQFFAYGHLPPEAQAVSRPFGELAELVVATLPRNAERTVALRKLLEAKDAAVRARIAGPVPWSQRASGGQRIMAVLDETKATPNEAVSAMLFLLAQLADDMETPRDQMWERMREIYMTVPRAKL